MSAQPNHAQNELEKLRIIHGRQGQAFAQKVCTELKNKPGLDDFELTPVTVTEFANGEIKPKVQESMRRKDVYVIQRFYDQPYGINEDLMELYLMNDAILRDSAHCITNIMPCMPYCRQDKKIEARVPISAKTTTSFLEQQGVGRLITMDLHAAAIQAFINCPVDNLYGKPLLTQLINNEFNNGTVLVSPDLGGASRVESYARSLHKNFVTIRKKRDTFNRDAMEMREVEGEEHLENTATAIIIDDIVDTGGTIAKSADILYEKGIDQVYVFCTHPLLSGNAMDTLKERGVRIVGTDTVPLPDHIHNSGMVRIESVAPYFAEAIYRIQAGYSLSESKMLFPP